MDPGVVQSSLQCITVYWGDMQHHVFHLKRIYTVMRSQRGTTLLHHGPSTRSPTQAKQTNDLRSKQWQRSGIPGSGTVRWANHLVTAGPKSPEQSVQSHGGQKGDKLVGMWAAEPDRRRSFLTRRSRMKNSACISEVSTVPWALEE